MGAGAAGSALGGVAMPAIVKAQTGLRVRPNIADLDNDHPILVAYKAAVTEMKRRSQVNPSDPTGWTAQAQIHNTRCPHSNWYFFPWHRAYLLAFEDICRQASGNPDFALPYWDWTQQRTLPAAVTDAGTPDAPNPLLDTTREAGANDQLQVLQQTEPDFVATILQLPEFETFGGQAIRGQTSSRSTDWQIRGRNESEPGGVEGQLEGGPHNQVHATIGGNMGDFLSPLDPIFWLHHCNVDRMWVVWSQCASGGARSKVTRFFSA